MGTIEVKVQLHVAGAAAAQKAIKGIEDSAGEVKKAAATPAEIKLETDGALKRLTILRQQVEINNQKLKEPVTLAVDASKAEAELALLEQKIRENDQLIKTFNKNEIQVRVEGALSTMRDVTVAAQGVAGALRIAWQVGKAFVEPAAEFEAYKVQLETLYGSAQKAADAFQMMKEKAAETPFPVADVVQAGIVLESYGVTAEENLGLVADLAARMRVTMAEAAEQLGRASTAGLASADRFREKGIQALVLKYYDLQDVSKVTTDMMYKALLDPASGVIGATEKLAASSVGAWSNMQDAAVNFAASVGAKVLPQLSAVARGVTAVFDALTDDSKYTAVVEQTSSMQREFDSLTTAMLTLAEKTDRTTFEQERLERIVSTVNERFGEYTGTINAQTTSYLDMAKAVATAREELIRLAAKQLVEAKKTDLENEAGKLVVAGVDLDTAIAEAEKKLQAMKIVEDERIRRQREAEAAANRNANLRATRQDTEDTVYSTYSSNYLSQVALVQNLRDRLEETKNKSEEIRQRLSEIDEKYADILRGDTEVTTDTDAGEDDDDDKLDRRREILEIEKEITKYALEHLDVAVIEDELSTSRTDGLREQVGLIDDAYNGQIRLNNGVTVMTRLTRLARSELTGMVGSFAAAVKTQGQSGFLIWKRLSQVQAVVDGSAAANSAWHWGMKHGGPIVAALTMGLSLATTGLNVHNIEKTKFADGGLYRGIGGPRDDSNLVRVSNGEYIVNARSTAAHLPLLDAINGTPMPAAPRYAYADGGLVSAGGYGALIEEIRGLRGETRAMNQNLVNKRFGSSITVQSNDAKTRVRSDQRDVRRMTARGDSYDVASA